jgi:hypothetical protein
VGDQRIDAIDLSLPGLAALIAARDLDDTHRTEKEEEAVRLLKADVAVGLHLSSGDDHVIRSIGIACRQEAWGMLASLARARGDDTRAQEYERMKVAVDEEFEALKREGEKISTYDVVAPR